MPQCASLPDEELCALLQQHFHIEGRAAFAEDSRPAEQHGESQQPSVLPSAPGQPALSVDEFVAKMLVLLDMEHDAEKAQVGALMSAQSLGQQWQAWHDFPL